MREILFRAKRADNGEWINGYLVELGKESFSDTQRYGICNKAIPLGGSGVCYNLKIDEVISETVGQYTGLTDKNDKKIFEWDILKVKSYDYDYEYLTKVFYNSNTFCVDVYGQDYDYTSIGFAYDIWDDENCEIEVIGNIHDNPELLKGDKLF